MAFAGWTLVAKGTQHPNPHVPPCPLISDTWFAVDEQERMIGSVCRAEGGDWLLGFYIEGPHENVWLQGPADWTLVEVKTRWEAQYRNAREAMRQRNG